MNSAAQTIAAPTRQFARRFARRFAVGVLYGRAVNSEVGHVLFAGGLGALYGGCANARGRACKTIPSIPLAAEVALHLGPVIGLGAQLFGNINQRDLMYGGTIGLQLGWFDMSRPQ